MAFWNKNKNWEDEYDEYYAQDRRLGNEGKRSGNGLRYFAHCLLLGFVGAVFLTGVGVISGQTMIEKMLTELLMPAGMVWVLLMVMVYFCFLSRQAWPALIGLTAWVVLTLGGNSFVSNWLISTLEAPYQNTDSFKMAPVQTLVVLGGGTNSRLNGQSQLGNGGDRVAMAGRLYHAGLTKKILCTGSDSFRSSAIDLHPREEAAEILAGLGVPAENILQIEGKNTSEEMRNLKKLIDEGSINGPVGILTSAWHLPRAERLAKSHGLTLTPVPSNFLTHPHQPSPNLIVPGALNLMITGAAVKEYLARLVGR